MSETYDNKAVNGKELAEQTLVGVAAEIKREGSVSAAAFNEVVARLIALEKAVAESNIGDRTADSLDSQSLKVGGTDVKTKQAAKSNPSASSGSANTFVDTITQNENGEITATRRGMKMYTGTGSNTDAPMTQKAASDAIALKANIASPTFTGTPAAPTVSGSTDTTQIATTAFVHDAIENDLKKAADVAGMGNDDTHAYSGEAVSMAISSAVSGNVGGFLGNMTVAQMNAYTNPKMGDNAIVTDTGTITVGSESCVITTAPSEVRWTTSGSWKISSAGYVRDTQVATTSVLGLVKLNTSNGGVELNSSNQMVVHGWSTKQDSLPYSDGMYGINISGTASYATAASPNSTLAQAIAPDADMVLLTGSSTFETALAAYNAGKKLYYVASGGTGVEYRVPLTYVMFQNTAPKAFVFQYVQDDHVDANQVGVVVVNKLTSTGWAAQSSLSVGYATSAGTANSAASASTPTPGSALAQAIDCILNPSNAASTEFSKAVTAYTAGQKMYCILGGSYEDDGNTYTFEKKVPLSYIVFAAGHVVAFCFKDVMDGHVEGSSNSGVIQTTVLRSNAWDQNVVNPYHAETASLAGNSYKWNGYDLAVGTLGGAGYISYL